jgi:hypothetical protein
MPVKVVIKGNGFAATDVAPLVNGKTMKVQFTKIAKSANEWIQAGIVNLLKTVKVNGKDVNLKTAARNFTITGLPTAAGSQSVEVWVDKALAGRITTNFEAPAEKKVELAEPKVSYESDKVKSACAGLQDKIESIFHAGEGYKGHGAVKLLGGANHAHVTNQDGIAFKWKGDTLHVVSHGVKNEKAPQGSCGYIWIR